MIIQALLVFQLFTSLSFAKTFEFKKEEGQTSFMATALGLKFEGKGTGPSGTIDVSEKISGELQFQLDTLDTGVSLRNTHMKDNYLETKKYPNATLQIEKIEKFNLDNPAGKYTFSGKLKVRNIEKQIENGTLTIEKNSQNLDIKAEFDTKISYFSMPIPKYAGLTLKDAVRVVVNSKVKGT